MLLAFGTPYVHSPAAILDIIGVWIGMIAVGFSMLDMKGAPEGTMVKAFDLISIGLGIPAIVLGIASWAKSRS